MKWSFPSGARFCAMSMFLLLATVPSVHATLIGTDAVFQNFVNGIPIHSGSATVVAGSTEYTQPVAGGLFNIDVEASSVTFFVSGGTSSVGFVGNQSFRVSGLTWPGEPNREIVGVNVSSVDVWGLLADPVSFSATAIDLFVGGSGWTYNTGTVTVELITANVPVPESAATIALLGVSLLGLVGVARTFGRVI